MPAVEPDILLPERRFRYSVPAGIDNGQCIRIREKKVSREPTAVREGDLLVEVNVARHPIFQRQDMNIFQQLRSHFAQAALGG